MGEAIARRGPDDSGEWWDDDAGVGFAHRRLSVIDLSAAGHQPMVSVCGRYVITFNGEIYNHADLRERLTAEHLAPSWRGHSDTETLLAAISAWGLKGALQACTGMFAFALWDREERTLRLARDRLGEKPLYYGWQGSTFLFGSELKALRAHPSFVGGIDRNVLALFMRYNYVPAPHSIHAGLKKLLPGAIATVSLTRPEPELDIYWSALQIAHAGVANPWIGSDEAATDALETLLKHAIGRQMMSDVPLGAFLSGGVDSSTIVALMQAQSDRPVKTFSIGFHAPGYDEAGYAKKVARHLGCDHAEFYVTSREAESTIPSLGEIYDEPFADPSQIPTLLVSRLARPHVTVSLSGDAGDELFCGYNRYVWARDLWRATSVLPRSARSGLGRALASIPPEQWSSLGRLLPSRFSSPNLGDKIHKFADVVTAPSCDALYLQIISHWRDPTQLVLGAHDIDTPLTSALSSVSGLSEVSRMMALDLISYLPDDNLVKVDRASMSVALESRVPFLDHSVVEFAWRLPLHLKVRKGVTKWLLRQVLYRYVPRELIERPKMGFAVPIDAWLRSDLRSWAEDLLSEDRLEREGFLNTRLVRQLWDEHVSGQRNWQFRLWSVLMFQSWRAGQESASPSLAA